MGWFKRLLKQYLIARLIRKIEKKNPRIKAEYMPGLNEYKVTYTDHRGNEISTVGSEKEIMPRVLELIASHKGGYAK